MAILGLISCVSKKEAHSSQAGKLYKSPLFIKSRNYVETRCDSWYILSAKFGLVHPSRIIDPYDETLNAMSKAEREQWAIRVWKELATRLHVSDLVIVLAGARYREIILPWMVEFGCKVEVPMAGMSIGRQLQWLSKQNRS